MFLNLYTLRLAAHRTFNTPLIYYYHGKKGGLINPLGLAYKVERREDYDSWERKKTVEMARGVKGRLT